MDEGWRLKLFWRSSVLQRSLAKYLRWTGSSVAASVVATALGISCLSADAQSLAPPPAQQPASGANESKPPGILGFPATAISPTLATVLSGVVLKPDLMNPDYLKYFLGAPDRGAAHAASEQSAAHYWYDRLRNPQVELHNERDVSTARQASVMVMHMPGTGLDIPALEQMLGPGGKRFFDYNGHPAVMYSFEPHTSVAFVSPHNSFAVRKAVVTYKGPLLPPPSEEDMLVARNHHFTKISELASKEQWHDYLHMVREGVQEHPNDPYAHVALAQALSRTGHVHDAIVEYKNAMAMSPGDQTLKQQCYEGLQRLHAIPVNVVAPSNTGIAGQPAGSQLAGKDEPAPF